MIFKIPDKECLPNIIYQPNMYILNYLVNEDMNFILNLWVFL